MLLDEERLCASEICYLHRKDAFVEEERPDFRAVESFSPQEEQEIISPLFPRKDPPYRIHWNWEVTFDCNYRCSYCPVPKIREEPIFTIKQLEEIWERMFFLYGVNHVRLSGGEPSLYPDFYELVALLVRRHVVDVTTNLSFDIETFVKKFKGESISISASFHPEYNKIEDFVRRTKILQDNGFCTTITFVTYPPFLKEVDRFRTIVEENGIYFKCIPFNGVYQGKSYPIDYQAEQLEHMRRSAEMSNARNLNLRWYDWRIKESEAQVREGVLCRMGQMYAKVFVNGDVRRCCAVDSKKLGNIGDKYFRLLEHPEPCDVKQCPCFKAMLVGVEEDKWVPLWTTVEHRMDKRETPVLK